MSRFRRAAAAAIGTMMTLFCAGSSCLLSDAVVNTSQYPVFGVDVSHYQGDINWKELEDQGVRFAFIKATEGSGHIDESVRDNLTNGAETDIKLSCYHFFSFFASVVIPLNFSIRVSNQIFFSFHLLCKPVIVKTRDQFKSHS